MVKRKLPDPQAPALQLRDGDEQWEQEIREARQARQQKRQVVGSHRRAEPSRAQMQRPRHRDRIPANRRSTMPTTQIDTTDRS